MAVRFIVILISIIGLSFVSCSTYCDFKKIFQTPVDSSRFDNYEIIERSNFADDPKRSDPTNIPKTFANAQVLVHVQNDKSKCKESCQSQPEIIKPSFCHYPPPHPYHYPIFNPYIPLHSYSMYPPFNPFANFHYPQWISPPSIESKLILDKPLEEDLKTAVQIEDDVFELPCDTIIKTCECNDQKDLSKDNTEQEIIDKIFNCGHTDDKSLGNCECLKEDDVLSEIPIEIQQDCINKNIIIDDYPVVKIPSPECLPNKCERDEGLSKVNYCLRCNKHYDTKHCLHCAKTATTPRVLEIPIQEDTPVKLLNTNCCPYCQENVVVNNYCSHCKRTILDDFIDLTKLPIRVKDDEKIRGVLVHDVKESTNQHLVDGLGVDNTGDNIDDFIVKMDYVIAEEDANVHQENNILTEPNGETYFFLDGRKIGPSTCGCCSNSGTKKPFQYDINDLYSNEMKNVLLPKSVPTANQLYKNQKMQLINEYPHLKNFDIHQAIPTIQSLKDNTPSCCNCGYTPCKCNIHQVKDATHKCCSCQYPCLCKSQESPIRKRQYILTQYKPKSYCNDWKDNFRSGQQRVAVPKVNRFCSSCAPYISELVSLSAY